MSVKRVNKASILDKLEFPYIGRPRRYVGHDEVLKLISQIWQQFPHLSFFQLADFIESNIFGKSESLKRRQEKDQDTLDLPNEILIEMLKEFIK